MIRGVLFFGFFATFAGALEILVAEGISAVFHPFDFRGPPPNSEPRKRIAFHMMLIIGLAALAAGCVLWVVSGV